MTNPKKIEPLRLNLDYFWKLLRRAKINPLALFIPALLGLTAAFFEGAGVSLLIPTIKGVIQKDIHFIQEIPILKTIIELLPSRFESRNSTLFALMVGLIFLSAVAKSLFRYLSATQVLTYVNRFANDLRKLIFERYLSYGKIFFDQHNLSHLQQILMGHTTSIATYFQIFDNSLYSFSILLTYLIIMCRISWPLTILAILSFPIFYYVAEWLAERIKKTSEAHVASSEKLTRKMFNVLSCIPLIKAYTTEKSERERFNQASDQVCELQSTINRKQMLDIPIHEIIIQLAVLISVVFVTFFLVYEKSGDIASYLVFFVILKRAMTALGTLGHIQPALAAIKGPISEILRIFEDKKKYILRDGKQHFNGLKNSIELRNFSFSYPKGIQALKDVTFSIKKGKMTALVGPSGVGKTTLANLIMRFYDPPPHTLLIDGVDIRHFTFESLRSKMAWVGQEAYLFNDTFRANLKYGLDGSVSDSEIMEVVEEARLYELTSKLPEGLETVIGDRGVKLSGGEKQRLSIARALLKKAEILILDEATSFLDSTTEKFIQDTIESAREGKTILVIAHRLSTIKHADKIVVIEDGRVMEEGTLDVLLTMKGRFYQYWEAQKFY